MSDFKASQELFLQLSVPNYPKKHWSASSGWEMADSMSVILADHTKKIPAKARFYAISADEVTAIDHESWLVRTYMSLLVSLIFQSCCLSPD
jgi:hypothetical protein